MPEATIAIIVGLLGAISGLLCGALLQWRVTQRRIASSKRGAASILSEAEKRQKELLLDAKEESIRLRNQTESELKERREEARRLEQRVIQKEEALDRNIERLDLRDRSVSEKEQNLDKERDLIQSLQDQQRQDLERVSQLTTQEAKDILLAQVEEESRGEAARLVHQIEQEAKEEADERSRKLLVNSMQRLTSEVVSDATISVVPLPSEDMKGRIIGQKGRNIRALERATGVDVIVDDTPDAVTLSTFDPVRREVARAALTKLITDGRIHPARIEETVAKAQKNVEGEIKEAGEHALIEAGISNLHPEIVKTLGRLKFRYSYGQNQLNHAVETANLAAMIAHELGANVEIARRGGLLHDLGKALTHEVEGTHAKIGATLTRRFGVNEEVSHCIEAHHEEVEPSTVEAVLTIVADAISGSRPGARRESLESYVKRLEALEEVANAFPGVEKSYAIQAGREIRVIVRPEDVDDLGATRLAQKVSKEIQDNLEYPGQIKVTVIREKRSVEYAK